MCEKTRICTTCKLELIENDENFASRYDRGTPQFQVNCRKCQKEYRRQHYLDNKQKYIDKASAYTDSSVEWFNEFKKTLKCSLCPENRHWVLDFHHIDPSTKEYDVSGMIRRFSKDKLMKEIEKCVVVCANCHRDLHYQEKNK